jgi:molybdenum cofactor cytidylyltransferase
MTVNSIAEKQPVTGILLMAGLSSRLGFPKALLPYGRKVLVERVLEQTLASRLDRVILVLGCKAQKILSALGSFQGSPRLEVVVNRRYDRGLSSSIRAGLRVLDPSASGVMFILGDQPLLNTATINRLIQAFRRHRLPIVVPLYGRRPGNPVIIGRELLPELQRLRGDTGGREIIRKNPDWVLNIPIRPQYIGWDVDTWEDYDRTRKFFSPTFEGPIFRGDL